MAILNQAFVDGAHAVARAVELHARQTVASSVTSVLTSATSSPLPSSITGSPSLSSIAPDTATPQPTSSPPANNNNNNNSGTSSPLLFFVALGFGVVFTNLWIIVGVKYCFRYNARNRQLRGAVDENGEPINLENMPPRPHRRRREKKLMTMDEVNEKFPMMKYKSWVADRAKEGLPTAGGVSAPPSRANSVRSVEGIVPELPSKERHSVADDRPDTSAASKPAEKQQADTPKTASPSEAPAVESGANLVPSQTAASIVTKDPDHQHASDDEDDDDHINAAIPPELLTTAGDTCAICIDTLEDDDDVRGLTCGHAFHAVCLDPWLTNRRACCPLCKADYYTPKPRPPPADGSDPTSPTAANAADPSRNNGRLNLPLAPQRTFGGWSLRPSTRAALGSRLGGGASGTNDNPEQRQSRTLERENQDGNQAAPNGQQRQGAFARFRSRFPPFRTVQPTASREEAMGSGAINATATPSQLEAGTRSTTN